MEYLVPNLTALQNGYAVTRTDSMDTELINNIGERSDTIIVTAYNDKNDIMKQANGTLTVI